MPSFIRTQIFTLISATFLVLSSPQAEAKSPCPSELRQKGTLVSTDLSLAQFTVMSNTSGGFERTFQTDGRTEFKGNAGSLSEMVLGDQVDVRWCFLGTGPFAARVDDAAIPVPNGQVIDLNVPPGTETVPVARVYGEDAGERFGSGTPHGIAFGDINGDGYADMIIGAYTRDRPASAAGAVDIIYGGPNVLGASVDLNTEGVISVHGETRILPSAGSQLMGFAVASGDVDGDGFDDVLLGSISSHGTGQVHIVFGSAQLPGTIITLDVDTAGPGDTLVLGQGLHETTGAALSTGDVNADGLADVIIGAPGQTFGSARTGGTVFVLYGDPALRGVTVDLNTGDAISVVGETRIFVESDGSAAGSAVAAGDVNGDGYDDVVIGAPTHNALFTSNRGSVFIVYGDATLPGTAVSLFPTTANTTWFSGRSVNNKFGTVVATGDVNADGLADVMIGAPGITGVGDNFAVGEVYIFYGSPSLPGNVISLSETPPGAFGETWITGTEEFGEFARSIGSADVNGDGFDDLVLGAPGAVPFGTLPETNSLFDGALYVLFGNATLPGQQFIDIREVADIIVFADNPNDQWGGSATAGGDIDRDGMPEYAAAAFLGDNPSIPSAENASGYVAAIAGQGTAPSTTRIKHAIAGDAPPADFGPVVRAALDYAAGVASTDTVTLTRAGPASLPISAGAALPVQWQVSTDRSGFTADLTFNYTDAELGTADESQLVVYTSPTGVAGSWVVAGLDQIGNELRNAITVTAVDTLGVFAIVDATGTGTTLSSDLALSIIDDADPVGVGDAFSYIITVANNGPDLATGVTVTETLPVGATFVASLPADCATSAGTVTCDLGAIANGTTGTVTVSVTADAIGTLTTTATAMANEPDPVLANNSAAQTTTVAGAVLPDLTVSITRLRTQDKNGDTELDLRWRVQNGGSGAATSNFIAQAFLSADSSLDLGTDTLLRTWSINSLAVGQTRSRKLKQVVPGDITGQHLIILIDANDTVAEENETNNLVIQQIP